MSYTTTIRHTRSMTQPVTALAVAVGQFLYGDEIRTRRSFAFSMLCLMASLLIQMHSQTLLAGSCH